MSNLRHWTNVLCDAVDNGLLSPDDVMKMCLSYMSESEVEDMCRINDLKEYLEPEDEEEELDPMDDFNYVGNKNHY